jgi:hypothetical protein
MYQCAEREKGIDRERNRKRKREKNRVRDTEKGVTFEFWPIKNNILSTDSNPRKSHHRQRKGK